MNNSRAHRHSLNTMKVFRYILAASPLVLLATTGCQPSPVTIQQGSVYGQEGLTVTGTAVVRAEPDLVILDAGVTNTSSSAGIAKTKTQEGVRSLIAGLKKIGLEEKDVQTTSFRLFRDYDYGRKTNFWKCDTSIQIRSKKVDKATELLDTVLASGANRVSDIQFTVDQLHELRNKARAEACRVAREKAQQLAGEMGGKLGSPVQISDLQNPWMNAQFAANKAQSVEAASSSAGEPEKERTLSSGSVAVSVTVSATYRLL